ncbi:DUF417 family protein [Halomonas cupida]|uniref:DUF417 family protein n=1 Tax=Halomonas cupida TaxID=44933 RepID=UPI003A8E8A6F
MPIPLWLPRILFAVFLVWTGAMRFMPDSEAYYITQFAVIGLTVGTWVSWLVGMIQLVAAVALFMPRSRLSHGLLLLYAMLALVPLVMLFTHPVWIESEGGFPVIGSGQGLIKYLGVAGVSLYFAAGAQPPTESPSAGSPSSGLQSTALIVVLAGLLLVMVWIGGMKFTAVEANGIERLLRSSPFMAWIYEVFSIRGGANLIGTVELLGALGLLFWRRQQMLFMAGALVNIATYTTTQTFLVTLPAWHEQWGFPALGSTGEFILKDLALLAGTLLLIRHGRPARMSAAH